MPATYDSIASTTLGSNQTTVEFTSISGSYTDLFLVAMIGNSANNERDLYIQVGNGSYDSGANYSRTFLYGNGTSAASSRTSNNTEWRFFPAVQNNTPSQFVSIHFQNYSNTTTNKTALGRAGFGSNNVGAWVGLWRSTSAINRIKLYCQPTADFVTGSTFTLYGIKAA